jgi:glycosyltransferase involved in cell wall biosynthesis
MPVEPLATPRFSLVVPTLRRSDTLRHTLATLTAQDGEDVEIVVQNNGDDPLTRAVVDALADPRVRHFASDVTVTMRENWEMALGHARGNFVAFIGDDDGLFPDACRIAGAILDRTGAQILSWAPFCYYWPNYVHPEERNRLVAVVDDHVRVRVLRSVDVLRRVYRFSATYAELPMLYNSFVARPVIEAVIAANGRYFVSRAPDVSSGILNAAYSPRFARLSRPLSMTGLSHHSVGHNTYIAARGRVSEQQTERDLGAPLTNERLVAVDNLHVFLAEEMLYIRDRVPSVKGVLDVDYRGLVVAMANAINDRPGSYDETLTAIRLLARRHDIDLTRVAAIPPRSDMRPVDACGVTPIGDGRVRYIVDGREEKLKTIADAITWIWRRMQHVDAPCAIAIEDDAPPVLRPGETIKFAAGAAGRAALEDGWGLPESWGAWSVAKRATLYLALDKVAPLHLRLGYRAFVHDRHPWVDVVCRHNGRIVATWRCAEWSGVVDLVLSASGADGLTELEFEISDPRSPAEFGLSTDRRLLGLGVEWLSLVD